MHNPANRATEERVLVLAPTGKDAARTVAVLAGVSVVATVCTTLNDLCHAIAAGAAAAVLTEEVVLADRSGALANALGSQPAWSDLPLVVLTGSGTDSAVAALALETLGNVTLLDRPVRVATLISAVRAALRSRHKQYEARDHLAERTRIAAELSEAGRRKDEFLALLGHELRNPLAPIRNAVYMLELRPDDPALVTRARGMIARQVAQMTRLVEELLDASRIERGKVRLTLERLDLAELVRTTIEDRRSESDEAELIVVLDVPPTPVPVLGDSARLAQIVSNLFHNALKFTPPGGRVAVRLAVQDSEVVLEVSDTGIGIPANALPTVFQAFRQVETEGGRGRGGLGLGLTVVKGLVELHSGRAEARSDGPGRGSTFTARLPLADGVERVASADAVATPATGKRVVIVEDGADTAASLRELLELKGFKVSVAVTGPDGVALCRRERPDAVVCDIGLPGMNGYEVALALRAEPATSGAILIAVSGYAQDNDRQKARDAGFDALLAKPACTDELISLLDRTRD